MACKPSSSENTLADRPDTIQPFSVRAAAPNGWLRRLRLWEGNPSWRRERAKSIGVTTLTALALKGAVWAFGRMGSLRTAMERTIAGPLAADVVSFCAWVLTAQRALSSPQLVSSHRGLATLLRCSQRRTGDVVRLAVALGLVEQRPAFDPVRGELACGYVATARLAALVDRTEVENRTDSGVSRTCQPTETESLRDILMRGKEPDRFSADSATAIRARGLVRLAQSLALQRLSGKESKRCAIEALALAAGISDRAPPGALAGLDGETLALAVRLTASLPA